MFKFLWQSDYILLLKNQKRWEKLIISVEQVTR